MLFDKSVEQTTKLQIALQHWNDYILDRRNFVSFYLHYFIITIWNGCDSIKRYQIKEMWFWHDRQPVWNILEQNTLFKEKQGVSWMNFYYKTERN